MKVGEPLDLVIVAEEPSSLTNGGYGLRGDVAILLVDELVAFDPGNATIELRGAKPTGRGAEPHPSHRLVACRAQGEEGQLMKRVSRVSQARRQFIESHDFVSSLTGLRQNVAS